MSDLHKTQLNFAHYIRSPDEVLPPAGIAPERLKVYRELFFNNVCNFINNAFVVLKSIYHSNALYQPQWQALQQQFFSQYSCESPYFLHIAEQFVDFLQHSALQGQHPPFLAELAHYEWAELYVATIKHSILQQRPDASELEQQPLQLSESALLAAYQYPVQKLSPSFQPHTPSELQSFLIYRDTGHKVVFVSLNQASLLLLNTLQQSPGLTYAAILDEISQYFPTLSRDTLAQGSRPLLQHWANTGAIIKA